MTQEVRPKRRAVREYSQLLRIQERLLSMLQEALDEIGAPTTLNLLRELRNRTGSRGLEDFGRIANSVEAAIRDLKLLQSDVQKELLDDRSDISVEGVSNLPAPLARFLAERTQNEHFSYEVRQDAVRGWVIAWKEYTAAGIVRGFGQFYERPYAWLDE
ncbi:MAG: hypothetical protein E4G90_05325 [Gemmatimonadales bacterium]|nr:MAG: hypothetical protein E4G90_05325 [Gemmatimonadales bacterium]